MNVNALNRGMMLKTSDCLDVSARERTQARRRVITGFLHTLVNATIVAFRGLSSRVCRDDQRLSIESCSLFVFTLWPSGLAEGGELGVEELGGEGAGEGFDGFALLRASARRVWLAVRASSAWRRASALLLERDDGGDGVAGLETLLVLVDLGG